MCKNHAKYLNPNRSLGDYVCVASIRYQYFEVKYVLCGINHNYQFVFKFRGNGIKCPKKFWGNGIKCPKKFWGNGIVI